MHASEHPPQCSVLPGTGVALLELSVSSSVCSVLGAARYRCGATGVVCLPFVTTLSVTRGLLFCWL